MDNKTKYSLILAVSALIIGAPAYLLSQTESTDGIAQYHQEKAHENITQTPNNIASINQVNAPAAGIHSIVQINSANQTKANKTDTDPIERIKSLPNKSELHQSILQDHEQFSRYAAFNKTFETPDQDPVVKRYEIEERTTQNPEDKTSLTIWSDKKYYLPGEQVSIFAKLQNSDGQTVNTNFLGQLIYNEKLDLQTFQFTDSDQDGIYEHSFMLKNKAGQALDSGLYKVLIVNKQNKLSDALTFILSEPEISLSGRFKDTLTKQGDLMIQAEVSVSSANRFYFQASLYSENKLPIGATQQALELNKGLHWVDLVFDHRMIKDAGEAGPYLLKNISLAKVTVPMQRAPLESIEYYTQTYLKED